jgi:hypothetical protein
MKENAMIVREQISYSVALIRNWAESSTGAKLWTGKQNSERVNQQV